MTVALKVRILVALGAIMCVSASLALAAVNRCCINADSGPPSTPLGAGCNWVNNRCTDNGQCNGQVWEVAVAGFCDVEEDLDCAAGAQTVVTLQRGTFGCAGATEATCACIWTENNPPVTDNVQIATCVGDGCP